MLGCSMSSLCGTGDGDHCYASVTDVTYKWVAVNYTIVKLVVKWNQRTDGTVAVKSHYFIFILYFRSWCQVIYKCNNYKHHTVQSLSLSSTSIVRWLSKNMWT